MASALIIASIVIAAGLVFGAVGVFIGHNYALLKRKCEGDDIQELGLPVADTHLTATANVKGPRDLVLIHRSHRSFRGG